MGSLQGDGSAILKVFIGAIIALTFIISIADSTFDQTNTLEQVNTTVTIPAINATTDLGGRTLIIANNVLNATDNATITTGVSLQTGVGTNGLQTVQITTNDTATGFVGTTARISYTYQPDGYLSNGGARSITGLIIIFSAVAIFVFVVVVFIKNGSLGKLMGRS